MSDRLGAGWPGLGERCRRAPRAPAVAALAVAAVVSMAACGGDEEPDEQATAPARQPTAEATVPADERRSAGGDGATEAPDEAPSAPGGAASGPEGCAFTPPPGRLAQEAVPIELSGVDCDEALPLAKAAALGQPAGANLSLSRDGFDCEPSTATKGANVTYTCVRGSDEVRFDVVWSEQGG